MFGFDPASQRKLAIFGTGTFQKGIQALFSDLDVFVYVDNDSKKANTLYNNCPVISPTELQLLSQENDIFILICSMYYSDISKQLVQFGFREGMDFYGITPQVYNVLNALYEKCGTKFSILSPDYILCDSLFKTISDVNDMWTYQEILIDELYRFSFNHPVVVWDIGMNTGLASLYFASINIVKRVYAYEPFGDTFLAAIKNLELNPHLSHKIKPYNYGVSDISKTLDADYTPSYKNVMSIAGIPEQIRSMVSDIRLEKIQVRQASQVFKSILEDNPGSHIVAKIDCEGSEYEIIEDLYDSDMLRRISMIMLEWHGRGAERLTHLLEATGFMTKLHYRDYKIDVGMLYAVNTCLDTLQ